MFAPGAFLVQSPSQKPRQGSHENVHCSREQCEESGHLSHDEDSATAERANLGALVEIEDQEYNY
jgi:hypothetical protein